MIKTAAFDAQRNENADSWQTELKARVDPRQRDIEKEPEKGGLAWLDSACA